MVIGWFFRTHRLTPEACAVLSTTDTNIVKWARQQLGRNREHLISWLKKISLGQLLFEQGTFSEPLVFKASYCLEILLPFLTFVNWKVPYRGVSSQPFPCFDIVFAQWGIIPKTRNKFAEVAAVAERHLTIIHVKNKESKKQPFRICLAVIICLRWFTYINKKKEISSYLVYSIVGLGKMAGKTEPFSWR